MSQTTELFFDGIDDYVELPTSSIPEGKTITVSFWAKGGSMQPRNNSVVYAGLHSSLDTRILNIHIPWGNGIYWDCGSDGTEYSAYNRVGKPPEAADLKDKWVHWGFTLDANSGYMAIYRNGALWAEEHDQKRSIPKAGNAKLGSGFAFYNGSLSDVRVWDKALTAAEIKESMSSRLTGKEPGLVSYWPLDEGDGTKVADKTGRNNDGTIHGATWQSSDLQLTPPKNQNLNQPMQPQTKVLSFENTKGPNDYVMVNPFNSFPTEAVTVELWWKTDSNNAGTPFSYATTKSDNTFLLYDYRSLHPYVYGANTNSRIPFNDGQWHHCAVTWESSTGEVKVYKDGKEGFSGTLSKGKTLPQGGALILGQEQDRVGGAFDVNQAFRGQMADVRIWDKVRTAEEIQETMKRSLAGDEPGLVLYWPLDEGEGSQVIDKTSNGNNGTMHGVTWKTSDLQLTPVKPNVVIATISYKGEVKRTQSDEYIEISNQGNGAADISGWKVTSNGKNQEFVFPAGTSLAGGKTFRVYTNEVHEESGGFSFGSKTAIWNDKGDTGKLFDAEGNEVSSYSYEG
ncbi:LamG-like jellyroll fold domain-containing protein [Roseofilum casamattae]|uniref:Lamin tail domain-containing protein n=1 Tax=Roseofilum casamattae BLCC-M143 TaxID=3022442 RepID=A0ABT7C283_9CYAN|nr:LamG-like jellyroll fold domain-containing protein [Roseofilum casamattae]MDJ1185568.1 lamin tail domain-containing protein [Roseofilum casamattae BLCC-M143]